jgi:hypothetical protein
MTLKPSVGGAATPEWSKSSYSTNDGPDCVEVAWFKSSYSTNDGADCVEVSLSAATVLVRDSKDPEGPHLILTPAAWSSFLAFASEAASQV